MAFGYIYKIKNEVTNQIYIGQTTNSVFLAAEYLGVSRTVVTNALIGYRKPIIEGWEVSYR